MFGTFGVLIILREEYCFIIIKINFQRLANGVDNPKVLK